jgi:hypothetical protein
VPSRLTLKSKHLPSRLECPLGPIAGHGLLHSITSSARASNFSQTKALALVPGICLQERALLPHSDGDGHDYRHACRHLHTQRRGRPPFSGTCLAFPSSMPAVDGCPLPRHPLNSTAMPLRATANMSSISCATTCGRRLRRDDASAAWGSGDLLRSAIAAGYVAARSAGCGKARKSLGGEVWKRSAAGQQNDKLHPRKRREAVTPNVQEAKNRARR